VLYNIANNPPPKIDKTKWSEDFCDFLDHCLQKDPEKRWNTDQLLEHVWLKDAEGTQQNFVSEFAKWRNSVAEPPSFNNL